MVKAKFAVLTLVAILSVFGAWLLFLKKDDASLIKARFAAFSSEVAKNGVEGATAAIMKSQAIANLFAETCELSIQDSALAGTYTREEMASHAFNARRHFQSVALSFHELEVKVEGDNAEAHFTALLTGTVKDGDKLREARDMTATLVKADGKWLFKSFKVREILRR